jgi:hypothetical protein
MAMGSLVAACALLFLKMRPDETSLQPQAAGTDGALGTLSGATIA